MGTSGLLIIAGSETTATLLSGVTYYLLKTPHAYAKLKEEVRGAFEKAEEITLTSTSQLPYLQACLEEALRLYPPVPLALPRLTRPEGDIIGGVFVPGNVTYRHRIEINRTDETSRQLLELLNSLHIMPRRTSTSPKPLCQNAGYRIHPSNTRMMSEKLSIHFPRDRVTALGRSGLNLPLGLS
jgi:hypothetical protein